MRTPRQRRAAQIAAPTTQEPTEHSPKFLFMFLWWGRQATEESRPARSQRTAGNKKGFHHPWENKPVREEYFRRTQHHISVAPSDESPKRIENMHDIRR